VQKGQKMGLLLGPLLGVERAKADIVTEFPGFERLWRWTLEGGD
jgi:hypothetical protein